MARPATTHDTTPTRSDVEAGVLPVDARQLPISGGGAEGSGSIVPGLTGIVHRRLHGLVPFIPLPRESELTEAERSAVTGLPTTAPSPACTSIFVGQVPAQLSAAMLAWAVNRVLGKADAVRVASVSTARRCGCVELTLPDAETAYSRSETALFDSTGIWVAQSPEQLSHLRDYAKRLVEREFGTAILRHPLPKGPMVLRASLGAANATSLFNQGQRHQSSQRPQSQQREVGSSSSTTIAAPPQFVPAPVVFQMPVYPEAQGLHHQHPFHHHHAILLHGAYGAPPSSPSAPPTATAGVPQYRHSDGPAQPHHVVGYAAPPHQQQHQWPIPAFYALPHTHYHQRLHQHQQQDLQTYDPTSASFGGETANMSYALVPLQMSDQPSPLWPAQQQPVAPPAIYHQYFGGPGPHYVYPHGPYPPPPSGAASW